MSKELIEKLHKAGFVILHANRTTNSPMGWKQDDGSMGYKKEMLDESLAVYKDTFNARKLSVQHCGFYLGFHHLCCIDFDVKKTSSVKAEALVKKLIAKYPGQLVVETTKSKGFHVYFRYNGTDKRNEPKFFSSVHEKNWIELYFHSRFIGCWLSATRKYELKYGDMLKLKVMNEATYKDLYQSLSTLSERVIEPPRKKKAAGTKEYNDKEAQERVNDLVEEIVRTKTDVTGGYHDWFSIGMGFANLFGEAGLDKFNAISQFSPSYNADTIEDTYNAWVEDDLRYSGKDRVTIATFFELCRKYKVGEVKFVRNGVSVRKAKGESKELTKQPEEETDVLFSGKRTIDQHVQTVVDAFMESHPYIVCNQEAYKYNGAYWEVVAENALIKEVSEHALAMGYGKAYTLSFMEKSLKHCMIVFRHVIEMNPFRKSFNMANGVLIFNPNHTIDFKAHSDSYLFTYQLEYDYTPKAACPIFDRFINRVIPNEESQQSLFKYVSSIFSERKIEQMFFLIGGGANGKSVLLSILQQLFGGACATTNLSRLTHPEHSGKTLYGIWNKLLAVSYDDKGIHDMQIYKSLASLEPLPVKRLYFDEFTTSNYARLIVAMNTWPMIEATIGARRRFIGIEMGVTIAEAEQDLGLNAKLVKELPGILNRVVEQHMTKADVVVSAEQKTFMDTIIESSDYVASYLKDCYVLINKGKISKASTVLTVQQLAKDLKLGGDSASKLSFATATELYKGYKDWCEANGIRNVLIKKNFVARVEAKWGPRLNEHGTLGYYVQKLDNE